MEHICFVVYKYICFMSTLPDHTDNQLAERERILRTLDLPLYNITKGIPWIAQKWRDIQQYLLTGNIDLMGEALLEAPSSRKVSLKPKEAQKAESEEEEDDISEHGQEEEEEDIFNAERTSEKAKSSKDKGKGKLMTEANQGEGISLFDTPKRKKSPSRGSSKSQSASQTTETSKPCNMKRGSHTEKTTRGDGDPDDSNDTSGEESGYDDDDRRPDRHRRPDKEEEAEETDRSVREITTSMTEWEKVTGQQQRPSTKK